MWRKARAGTLDAFRERRKLRFGAIVAPIIFPLFGIMTASMLTFGIMTGSLRVPLRGGAQVHWSDNPVGFILVATAYVFMFALCTFGSWLIWTVRRDRLEAPHSDFIAPTNFSNR